MDDDVITKDFCHENDDAACIYFFCFDEPEYCVGHCFLSKQQGISQIWDGFFIEDENPEN